MNRIKTPRAVFGAATMCAAICGTAKDNDFSKLDLNELMKIDVVVVTANKQGVQQRLQDIPSSITVVDQSRIESAGMEDFLDYACTIPGMGFQIKTPAGDRDDIRGGRRLNLRGIESGFDSVPTTAFYLDETPIPVMDPKLFDVARIEVLRGPQGTLYGANSMGGTVRMVMNTPVLNKLLYTADAGIASTNKGTESYSLDGMLNIPLVTDKVALRGVAFLRDEGGFIDRVPDNSSPIDITAAQDINGEESWGGRLAMAIDVNSRFKITPSIFHQQTRVEDAGIFEPDFRDLSVSFLAAVPEKQNNDFTLYGVEANYALTGSLQIFSSTSYFASSFNSIDDGTKSFFDFDGPAYGIAIYDNAIRNKRTSQELRLAYAGTRWKGVLGGFYMNEDRYFDQYGDTEGTGVWFTYLQRNDERQYALFGEGTYDMTEHFSATAGARWFKGEQDQYTFYQLFLDQPPGSPFVDIFEGDASASSFSPKLQMSYRAAKDKMVYAAVAKGFRPGGPTSLVPATTDCLNDLAQLGLSQPKTEFGPDTLWNYEIGTKSSFARQRITVNATAYYIDWKDVQQTVSLNCGFTFVGNVGAARSSGVELEFWTQPLRALDVSGSFGYTDAKFTRTNPQVGVTAGDRFPLVPKLTGALALQYSFIAPAKKHAFIRGDYQYMDSTLEGGTGNLERPAYTSVDLRLGVNLSEKMQMSLFVKNAFDERAVLSAFDNVFYQGIGGDIPSPFVRESITARPRTIGLIVRYRY